jgi:predicted ATPase with chaperone activity
MDTREGVGNLEGLLDQLTTLAKGSSADRAERHRAGAQAASARIRPPLRDEELAGGHAGQEAPDRDPASENASSFFPVAPRSLARTGIAESEVEAIILRLLLHRGTATGIEISQQLALPFCLAEKVLHALKAQRMVVFKNPATLSDYVYEMTDAGLHRARRCAEQCGYCGAAPVSLADYVAGVAAQSLQKVKPRIHDLRRAFADLTISEEMFFRLGRAITSGRGLFLYGSPGNGKTSIAERITAAYGTSVWIPRALSVWGEIVRVFDPSCHEEIPLAKGERIVDEEKVDARWVRIRRPTIVVGGELTMDNLEITVHKDTGVSEAPVQMKSNCGTLVIDDFGRQRISPATLLNRWIVPLEKRHDYLTLASGRKICVPFDQFTVFSTNLEPRDLVDEAFLRRIPYKIDVENPTLEQFQQLFQRNCEDLGIRYHQPSLDHLVNSHYEKNSRQMRFCHARDLLHQVSVYCKLLGRPAEMGIDALDAAAKDYFSVV